MNIDVIDDDRHAVFLHLFVVGADEDEIYVGLVVDIVVRQAATQDGGKDMTILLHLLNQLIEGSLEAFASTDICGRGGHDAVIVALRSNASKRAYTGNR